jgi:hypothetical protein
MSVKSKSRGWRLLLAAIALFGITGGLRAQEPEPEAPAQPKPAGRGIPGMNDNPIEDQNQQQGNWNPDTMPLTGLQTPTVGNPEMKHSYMVPGLQFGSTIQNQPFGGGSSGWYSDEYFGANLSWLQQWSRSQLALNYSGGGFVTSQTGQSDGWFQNVAFGQNFTLRRWQMQILDQFAYLPQTQFGFGGGTGLSLPGIGGGLGPSVPGIGGSVTPNQSIYSATGPRYSNSVVTQITYDISRRSSVTFGGSYGLLHFTQSGNVNTDSYIANAGYNYQITKDDSVGLSYRFTSYHYQGIDQAIGDHMFSVSYGRKIAKRLGLQIYGGPEITNYRIPINNQTQTIAGSGGASLSYAFQRGNLTAAYFHGVAAGGGVLIGSTIDQVTFSGVRRVTRLWSVQGNVGFAKNRPLASQTGVQGNDYDSIYVGGGVSRPFGKEILFSAAYTAQIEQINPTVCTGTGCNTNNTQNMISVSLQWHSMPIVLR